VEGWVRIHRKIRSNWIWADKPYSYGQAWIDLVISANHQDKAVLFSKQLIDCKRGEVITSEVKLAEKWGWSRSKLRNFLAMLKVEKMCTATHTANYTTLFIENYGGYQDLDTADDTGSDTAEEQLSNSSKTQTRMIKNDKNIKKETKAKKESEIIPQTEPLSEIQQEDKTPLQKWISEKLKNVSKMEQQITKEESEKLLKNYSRELVMEKLEAMDNTKGITKKYVSVYKTCNNWCRMKLENDSQKTNTLPFAGRTTYAIDNSPPVRQIPEDYKK
jgi:DNA replication protein DnaD